MAKKEVTLKEKLASEIPGDDAPIKQLHHQQQLHYS